MTTEAFERVQEVKNIYPNLKEIQNNLFDVVKIPLIPSIEENFFNSPEHFGIYKKSGGACLGVHGSRFDPMQPKEFFDAIINTALNYDKFDLSKLKFKEYFGGKYINFDIEIDPLVFTNNAGNEDVTNFEISFNTAYNGLKSNTIDLKTRRLVCSNGMTAINTNLSLKSRNTKSGKKKIFYFINEVAKTMQNVASFKELLINMDKAILSNQEVSDFINELFEFEKIEDKKQTRKVNLIKKMNEAKEIEFQRTGQTAFGLLQSVTYFTNHLANIKDISRDEYIYFRTGDKLNKKAQNLIVKKFINN